MSDDRGWWRKRAEAFLDSLIFYVVIGVGTLLVGLAAAFGTEDAALPLWLVVLFGAVQVLTIVSLVILWRRPRAVLVREDGTQDAPPPPHPHAALLARIDASVRGRKMEGAIPWPIASAFNRILADAREVTDDAVLDDIEAYERGSERDEYAYSGYIDALEASLARIRVAVEHANE